MRFRGILQMGLTVGLLIAVVACGAAGGDEQAPTSTGDPGGSDTTTTAATDTTTAAGTDTTEPDSGGSSDLPEMSGGSATFTLAGETEEFDWFVCFYGDAVAMLEDDEDISFLGVGRRGGSFPSLEGVEAQVVVVQVETPAGLLFNILYTRIGSDGAETNWQAAEFDAGQLEGDRVTFEGEFDNQPSGELFEMGALDATCSPNSVGSDE